MMVMLSTAYNNGADWYWSKMVSGTLMVTAGEVDICEGWSVMVDDSQVDIG